MHTACAFLNTDGGWLIFGVAPSSLKIIGQQVTDNTRREIAQALSGLEPAINVDVEYIDVPNANGNQVICMHFDGYTFGNRVAFPILVNLGGSWAPMLCRGSGSNTNV